MTNRLPKSRRSTKAKTVRQEPAVGMRTKFPYQVAVTCWIDLLGYGDLIAASNFNPLHPKATRAVERLEEFHAIVAKHSDRNFRTLVMNDGAAVYRDLSYRSSSVTFDFLIRAWRLFQDLKLHEQERGFPGPRLVLAAGFRLRRHVQVDKQRASHLESVLTRFRNGEIGSEEAIREASTIRKSFDVVPELQANFAFTKAYVEESSGSKAGLAGGNFFVDLAIFAQARPDWLNIDGVVNWRFERLNMAASFGKVVGIGIVPQEPGKVPGMSNALEVAQYLTQDKDVLAKLRESRR